MFELFSIMSVIFVDVEREVNLFFSLSGRSAKASGAADFTFESGSMDGRVVARMGLDDNVGVGGFPIYFCAEFAFIVSCQMYVKKRYAVINFGFASEFNSWVNTV